MKLYLHQLRITCGYPISSPSALLLAHAGLPLSLCMCIIILAGRSWPLPRALLHAWPLAPPKKALATLPSPSPFRSIVRSRPRRAMHAAASSRGEHAHARVDRRRRAGGRAVRSADGEAALARARRTRERAVVEARRPGRAGRAARCAGGRCVACDARLVGAGARRERAGIERRRRAGGRAVWVANGEVALVHSGGTVERAVVEARDPGRRRWAARRAVRRANREGAVLLERQAVVGDRGRARVERRLRAGGRAVRVANGEVALPRAGGALRGEWTTRSVGWARADHARVGACGVHGARVGACGARGHRRGAARPQLV